MFPVKPLATVAPKYVQRIGTLGRRHAKRIAHPKSCSLRLCLSYLVRVLHPPKKHGCTSSSFQQPGATSNGLRGTFQNSDLAFRIDNIYKLPLNRAVVASV